MWNARFFLLLSFVALSFAQTQRITGPRPLGELADRLEAVWARPISYEEPVWMASDLSTTGSGPRSRSVEVQVAAFPNRDRNQDVSYLGGVLVAFNRDNRDLQYQVIETSLGFAFVPEKRPQSIVALSGQSRTVLDELVSVPTERRTGFGHVVALAEALTARLGFKVEANTPILGMGFDRLFSGTQFASTVNWGTNSQVPAREALSDLLLMSATSMSWRLNCQPPSNAEKAFCVLNVAPLRIETLDQQGRAVKVTLEYDRCQRCPPLVPRPSQATRR